MSEWARRRPWTAVAAGAAGLAVAVHLWGLYRVAGPPGPSWFPAADKVEHLVGFAVPVALVLAAVVARAAARGEAVGPTPFRVVAALFGGHAVVSEVVQHLFYSGRTGDPFDTLADLLGVVVGLRVGVLVDRRLLTPQRVPA